MRAPKAKASPDPASSDNRVSRQEARVPNRPGLLASQERLLILEVLLGRRLPNPPPRVRRRVLVRLSSQNNKLPRNARSESSVSFATPFLRGAFSLAVAEGFPALRDCGLPALIGPQFPGLRSRSSRRHSASSLAISTGPGTFTSSTDPASTVHSHVCAPGWPGGDRSEPGTWTGRRGLGRRARIGDRPSGQPGPDRLLLRPPRRRTARGFRAWCAGAHMPAGRDAGR